MSQVKTAPVDMFTTLRPRLLIGGLLKDIKAVEASISRFGLLSPIIVTRANGRLVVVDGRKRLAAIKRLEFMGRLPRSLVKIPYLELKDVRRTPSQAPALMSNRDLYVTVTNMFRKTQDVAEIASDLFLTRKCVTQVLTLARLSQRLRQAFFDKVITFESAKTYAAFPGHARQNRAFLKLGPFVDEHAILEYMATQRPSPKLSKEPSLKLAPSPKLAPRPALRRAA